MNIKQEDIIQINEEGQDREYEFDGKRFPSVTTIINTVLDKPALPPWAQDVGVKGTLTYVRNEIEHMSMLEDMEDSDVLDYIANSIKAHEVKRFMREQEIDIQGLKEAGGSRGLSLHDWLEALMKGQTPNVEPQFKPYVNSLEGWLEAYNPKPVCSEYKIIHPMYGYGGTLDLVAVINKHPSRRRHVNMVGEDCLLDFKSNKEGRVYADHHLPQVEAYCEGYTFMGHTRPIHRAVVGIGPEDKGKPKFTTCVSYHNLGTFIPLLTYYRAREAARKANPNARNK